MTLKSLLKPALLALSLIPLSACSSLFKPDRMTIEYDEEVKLHDGEMIWVHITRHYGLSSGIFGDPGGMESSYKPTNVEISWETGFEGVGRKSVYFSRYIGIIDKYDGKWYVAGNKNTTDKNLYEDSINCNNFGASIWRSICMVGLDASGNYFKPSEQEVISFYSRTKTNILSPNNAPRWEGGAPPRGLEAMKLDWNEKIRINNTKPEERQYLDERSVINLDKLNYR